MHKVTGPRGGAALWLSGYASRLYQARPVSNSLNPQDRRPKRGRKAEGLGCPPSGPVVPKIEVPRAAQQSRTKEGTAICDVGGNCGGGLLTTCSVLSNKGDPVFEQGRTGPVTIICGSSTGPRWMKRPRGTNGALKHTRPAAYGWRVIWALVGRWGSVTSGT